MTHVEHLLENAIRAINTNYNYQQWIEGYPQKIQFSLVKASPEEIWDIAQYCVFTYKSCIIRKVEDAYGYSIPT